MSSKLKGLELDKIIEKELILMCDEGFESTPITQANLFRRLKSKGVISTRSTLTNRKELIDAFSKQQKEEVKGPLGQTLKNTTSMTRADLEKANSKLIEQVKDSRKMVQLNTMSIIGMVKTIRLQTSVRNIERCLSPFLIRELHNSNDFNKE